MMGGVVEGGGWDYEGRLVGGCLRHGSGGVEVVEDLVNIPPSHPSPPVHHLVAVVVVIVVKMMTTTTMMMMMVLMMMMMMMMMMMTMMMMMMMMTMMTTLMVTSSLPWEMRSLRGGRSLSLLNSTTALMEFWGWGVDGGDYEPIID